MTRTFPLGQVLSVTTGILLCEMSEVYDILNYMTQDNLFTHQLPRAAEVCKPAILEQHPILKKVSSDGFSKTRWKIWLDKQYEQFPAEYTITPVKEWESRNPIEEAAEMVGVDKLIVAVKE